MDKRNAKIIVNNAGGTASGGAKTYKLALPTKWVRALGLDDGKSVELCFDGDQIVISKRLSMNEFVSQKKKKKHSLLLLDFFDGEQLCSKICADISDETLVVENYTDNLVKTAFGKNEQPRWLDFINFLEERCVPKSRSGIREYLETIGVDEYEPLKIIEKTNGRMAEDQQWISMERI